MSGQTSKIDVQGVLERAGADANAPEGSGAWALEQVRAAVVELIEADLVCDEANRWFAPGSNQVLVASTRRRAALARFGGTNG